jgi:hypothetical protein
MGDISTMVRRWCVYIHVDWDTLQLRVWLNKLHCKIAVGDRNLGMHAPISLRLDRRENHRITPLVALKISIFVDCR